MGERISETKVKADEEPGSQQSNCKHAKKDALEGRRRTVATKSTARVYTAEALCALPQGVFYLHPSSHPINRTKE